MLTDANVILRFLLDDHPQLSPRATAVFERAAAGEIRLLIPAAILAECVYTLKSFYKLDRATLAAGLLDVLALPGVEALEGRVVGEALRVFGAKNVDFADAYLNALSLSLSYPVVTFDRDLSKLGAELLET
ncbi:PIN domain-containing protein [Deinococcus saxicola]|uniref:PIN domain-containing protein n=1 Tax=Deinococcus saxicola TaxID=249406 RepID=UPI0039EE5697